MSDYRLDIDPLSLDVEWREHAFQTKEARDAAADAWAEADAAKSKLKVIEAELELEIRRNPKAYGFEKSPTIPEVNACVLTQALHKNAVRALRDQQHAAKMADNMVEALDDRKKALENLVKLLSLDYHGEPRTTSLRDDERERKIRERMRGVTRTKAAGDE